MVAARCLVAQSGGSSRSLQFPQFSTESDGIARRISSSDALENLVIMERTQSLLHTNVQEALALEVGFLKLKLG